MGIHDEISVDAIHGAARRMGDRLAVVIQQTLIRLGGTWEDMVLRPEGDRGFTMAVALSEEQRSRLTPIDTDSFHVSEDPVSQLVGPSAGQEIALLLPGGQLIAGRIFRAEIAHTAEAFARTAYSRAHDGAAPDPESADFAAAASEMAGELRDRALLYAGRCLRTEMDLPVGVDVPVGQEHPDHEERLELTPGFLHMDDPAAGLLPDDGLGIS